MKGLYTQLEFDLSGSRDLLKCECYHCGNTFLKEKRHIKHAIDHNVPGPMYCNKKCLNESKINGAIVNCKQCNAVIYRHKTWLNNNKNHFCNNSCAAIFNNTGQKQTKETKDKISKTLKGKTLDPNRNIGKRKKILKNIDCNYCKKEFMPKNSKQQYCSKKCANDSPEKRKKLSDNVQEQIKNGTHQGWHSRKIRSYAELFFEQVLINLNVKFEVEYKIKKRDLGLNENYTYFLDFYLPDYNLDLEIDGRQHEYTDRKISDKKRDTALLENGYNVHRIKWKNTNTDLNKKYIEEEIEKFKKLIKI